MGVIALSSNQITTHSLRPHYWLIKVPSQ